MKFFTAGGVVQGRLKRGKRAITKSRNIISMLIIYAGFGRLDVILSGECSEVVRIILSMDTYTNYDIMFGTIHFQIIYRKSRKFTKTVIIFLLSNINDVYDQNFPKVLYLMLFFTILRQLTLLFQISPNLGGRSRFRSRLFMY